MKPTKTILVCVLAAGLASAQSPRIIQNTRDTMNGVANNATAASNAAMGEPAPSAASARTHGAAQAGGTAKSVTVKAQPAGVRAAGPKHLHGAKRIGVIASVPSPETKPVPAPEVGAPAEASAPVAGESESAEAEQSVVPDSKYAANGRRDPFLSPVVSHAGSSGCSTGKKCLEIGTINLRGVVHAENGFIAVVSNGLNKAYFLRENDPVFNGYVVKITGDSIVFQETLQDRLGKSFTREVVKKITTPAV
ncbi:MAG: hypothetical protein ABSD75_18140 [Terriglobales bacterium]|jgi:Tfp pilus assembly protein PilP